MGDQAHDTAKKRRDYTAGETRKFIGVNLGMISHGAVQAVKEYRIRGICGQQKRSAYPPDSLFPYSIIYTGEYDL